MRFIRSVLMSRSRAISDTTATMSSRKRPSATIFCSHARTRSTSGW